MTWNWSYSKCARDIYNKYKKAGYTDDFIIKNIDKICSKRWKHFIIRQRIMKRIYKKRLTD